MLSLAERDLIALQSLSNEAPQEAFGFFVQQTMEKAFKARLALLGELYPLTRSLETLLDRGAAAATVQSLLSAVAQELTEAEGGRGGPACVIHLPQ